MSPKEIVKELLKNFHPEEAYTFVEAKLDGEDRLFWFDVLLELNSETPKPIPKVRAPKDPNRYGGVNNPDKTNILADDFLAPPINVINMMQSHVRGLERKWKEYNFIVEGRPDHLIGAGISDLFPKAKNKTGTSRFSPAICEIMYSWFCPDNGRILDTFAGGSVRGIVASELGYNYIGIDISETQLRANVESARALDRAPTWLLGNSQQQYFSSNQEHFDFLFTCPPYYNLEIYSSNPNDLSQYPTYSQFIRALSRSIKQSASVLKEDRFAVMVVGDIRDKETGFYRNFPGDVIRIHEENGLHLYNFIQLYHIGSGHLRCRRPFMKSRKITKVQQTALVFVKGDPLRATQIIKESAVSKK